MLNKDFFDIKSIVDNSICDFLPTVDEKASLLSEAMKYSLTAGGKRIRSVLMLSFYKLASKNAELSYALPFACAIEFIQTYSLIHDDLPAMDNDDYRRGMLTNHKVYGEDVAILAGDGLLSSAYELMLTDSLKYIADRELFERKVKAAAQISTGTGVRGMVQGQLADVKNEGKLCSREMLSFIDNNKTASFIKSAVLAGCYLGGADERLLENAAVYGECLGHAFQVVDDIMDVISTKEERGKAVGKDSELEKSTYPAIYGLEESKEIAKKLLSRAVCAIKEYDAPVMECIADYLLEQIS